MDEKLQKVVLQNPVEPTNQIENACIKLLIENTDRDGYWYHLVEHFSSFYL